MTDTALDIFLDRGWIKQDLDSYSDSPIPSAAQKESSSNARHTVRKSVKTKTVTRRTTTQNPRKSLRSPQIDMGLINLGDESAKLMKSMEDAKSDGTEVDNKFASNVNRLTRRITVLQKDQQDGKIDEDAFVDKMVKIEKELGRIDTQLGLAKESVQSEHSDQEESVRRKVTTF